MRFLETVIEMKLNKGYDVKDTKYKAGLGRGQLKRGYEAPFNLMRPEK
jgi:hypothetical protein